MDNNSDESELPKVLEQPEIEVEQAEVHDEGRRKSLTPPHEQQEAEAETEETKPEQEPPPKSLTPHLNDSKSDMIPLSQQGSVISLGIVSV